VPLRGDSQMEYSAGDAVVVQAIPEHNYVGAAPSSRGSEVDKPSYDLLYLRLSRGTRIRSQKPSKTLFYYVHLGARILYQAAKPIPHHLQDDDINMNKLTSDACICGPPSVH